MTPLLSIQDLHIRFKTSKGHVLATSGVNIDLFKGETLGIVGESGCGKSATAKAVMQLLPSHTTTYSGKIVYEDKNLLDLSDCDLRKIRGKKIGMILQDPMTSLNPTMRIGEQIMEGILRHEKEITRQSCYQKAIEMLHLVGITSAKERMHSYPHMLSGGMRQRVLIATALSCHPHLLIADEPTTALDVTIQAQILSLLADLKKRFAMSIMLITHDLSVIAGLCDRVVVMYAGQVVETASIDELFYSPKHPYTQRLFAAIPKIHACKDTPLTPIEGHPPTMHDEHKGCPFAARCPHAMKICLTLSPKMSSFSPTHTAACWMHHKEGDQ